MGYSTEFTGTIAVTPPLNAEEIEYLRLFAATRHVERHRGPYYVDGQYGHGDNHDVINDSTPSAGQPGLWCQWVATSGGAGIEGGGEDGFSNAHAWMQYIIDHFLRPGGHAKGMPGFEAFTFDHTLNGSLVAQGDDLRDEWQLDVDDNTALVFGLTAADADVKDAELLALPVEDLLRIIDEYGP
ncbi:hypothetical protein ACLMAL_39210 [Nocardia sp. CWNU-33]|uniref:hypothetical protein n=1 Tax=Nocardia sp. CWNU-33 TaxID=3392117 RepID=UPI00398F4541